MSPIFVYSMGLIFLFAILCTTVAVVACRVYDVGVRQPEMFSTFRSSFFLLVAPVELAALICFGLMVFKLFNV